LPTYDPCKSINTTHSNGSGEASLVLRKISHQVGEPIVVDWNRDREMRCLLLDFDVRIEISEVVPGADHLHRLHSGHGRPDAGATSKPGGGKGSVPGARTSFVSCSRQSPT